MTPTLLLALALASAAPETLTFDEALGLAEGSPAVAAARAAADEGRRAASSTPRLPGNPELLVQPRLSGPAGGSSPQGEAQLTWSLNLAALLGGARTEGAQLEAGQLAAEARALALSRKLDAARAWLDLWGAQVAQGLARQEMDIALQLAERSERAAASAILTRAEAADAHTYGFEAQVTSFQLEGEVTDLGFVLAGKAGLAAARPVGATGSLPRPDLPPEKDWPALVERAIALPEARARALSARAERAREAEARAARGLALTLGARAVRDGSGDSWFGVAGLSLPLLDRGQREAAPLAALARLREGEAAEASRQAGLELARSFHEVEHTGEILDALQGALVPAAAEGARLRDRALQAGDATVLEVLLARRTLASARARAARAEAGHAWARVKVWLLLEELSRPGDSK